MNDIEKDNNSNKNVEIEEIIFSEEELKTPVKVLFIRYLIVLSSIVFLFIFLTIGVFYYFSKELPPASEVLNYKFDTGSEVFDANGKLIHMYAFEQRKLVELNEVPPYLIDMLIETEDSNFYNHWGIDIFGVLRATIVNLRSRRTSQGASTITQQLARNMFLSTEKIYSRKIKEAMLAVIIETQFTKQEILESYLNKVLFGNGYYGIETASLNYFQKNSSELSVSEAALLVGLLKGSGFYNPLRHPERAKNRRNLVLTIAYEKGIISAQKYKDAINEELIVNHSNIARNRESDYFIEFIRPYIERKYGTNTLFTGGLKIYTTIDYDLQQYADSVLNAVLTEHEKRRNYKNKYSDVPLNAVNIKTNYLQGGVYAIDPHTGFVRVMIGGRNFRHSKFNRVMQARRQPGSCFKPILYSVALDKGFTTSTIISDEPLVFMRNSEIFWEPKNYTRDFRGNVTLREAMQRSINVVAAKILCDVGAENVVKQARLMNLTTAIHPYLSLSVGSCEVLPFELITAYTAYPGRGEIVKPIYITKITDNRGRVLEQYKVEKKRVLDPKIAYLTTDLLKTVIDEGTGISARYNGFNMPAGGKTGTTDDYRDAWFIGFTKNLVMGTWTGFDDNTSMGSRMTGGSAALPIWTPIMKYYEQRLVDQGVDIFEDFDMPEGIIRLPVSMKSGLLPLDLYEPTKVEVFIEYTEPTRKSELNQFNFYPETMFSDRHSHIVNVR